MNVACKDHRPLEGKPCFYYIRPGTCALHKNWRCIEYLRRKSPILSYSYIRDYLRCRRLFYWTYIKGIRTVERALSLTVGEIIHSWLAYLHSDPQENKYLINAETKLKELYEQYSENEDTTVPTEIVAVEPLINAYMELGMHEDLKGEVEKREITELNGYTLKTRADLIVGEHIYDWKYTSKPDGYTFFTTRLQAGMYLMNYPKAKSITFRLIQKPTLRLGKNETEAEFRDRIFRDVKSRPKHYFKEITFYRSEYDFSEIDKEIKTISDEIRANIDRDIDFFIQEYNCYFPGPCDFLRCCEAKVNPLDLPELYEKINLSFEEMID